MNRKLKKLIKNPKAYFYDYFRKKVRNQPNALISLAIKASFANSKSDLGFGKEINNYLKLNKLEYAENICIEAMTVVPKAIRPYVLYAEVSMRKRNFIQAVKRWQSVVEKFPDKAEGYAGEARAYVAIGDFERVEDLCMRSIENMPQEPWPYIELAEISMRQRDFKEALNRWQNVREKFPARAVGYVRGSLAYSELGKFSKAEDLCRWCMNVASNDIRPYIEYAEISMRKKNFEEALKRWQTVQIRFSNKAVGYVKSSICYCALNDYLKAEELCRLCMERIPNDITSFDEYAQISMRADDYKEASNRWEIVRDKFPDKTNGYLGGAGHIWN